MLGFLQIISEIKPIFIYLRDVGPHLYVWQVVELGLDSNKKHKSVSQIKEINIEKKSFIILKIKCDYL